MRSNQVYQPTTASLPYDRSKSWLSSFMPHSERSTTWNKLICVAIAGLFITGLIMIIVGATLYHKMDNSDGANEDATFYITVLCVGAVLEVVMILAIVIYTRNGGHYIPCCPGKIARIRKHLQEGRVVCKGKPGERGDPVSAQYCPPNPPCDNTSPPTPFTDLSEQQHLMEKSDTGDESEKIIDDDPRIVLSPMKTSEEC